MEADGCLAGARSALHGEQEVERGTDDLVLLGLDGGDDVEHLAGAGPLELGEQRVAAPEAGGGRLLAAATEQVVGHGDDLAAIHHDLATAGQPERVLGARPVEGHRHGRPPVHDDGIGPVSSTWRRPMCQVGPSSSSIRPKRRGRGLSASSDTRRDRAAT